MLQSGHGGPIPPQRPTGGRGGRRAGLIAAGAVLGVGVLAAGAWAGYTMFFASGAQPAEALPDTTVGYVSFDLDPSGKQKLEAVQALRKFPAFSENVDLAVDEDLRMRLFEELQGDGICEDIDFADDIDPWLGNRFAAAAIDLGAPGVDEDEGLGVTGVGVLQIDDPAAAEDGLEALSDCGGEGEEFGWSVVGDWAIVAETTELAEQVTDAAAEAPLSGDESFQRWTDEAGDPGILTAYVAPEAGKLLSEAFAGLGSLGATFGPSDDFACASSSADPDDPFGEDPFAEDPFSEDPFAEDPFGSSCDELSTPPDPAVTDQMQAMFDDFEGAALTIRFRDGGLEVETAGGSSSLESDAGAGDGGDDVVATLPENTAVAFGIGLEEGWFDDIGDYADGFLGEGGLDELLTQAEEETGLDLPADLETLLGDSTAVALGGDVDLTAFEESEPPTDLQLGVKVRGDADAIGGVLDQLLGAADDEELNTLLAHDSDGDHVVAGPSSDYRSLLAKDGGLGDTDVYRDAVVNSDRAGSVLFVNFDAGSWLTSLPDMPTEVRDNLAPLRALGLSGWNDEGVSHLVIRVTTE